MCVVLDEKWVVFLGGVCFCWCVVYCCIGFFVSLCCSVWWCMFSVCVVVEMLLLFLVSMCWMCFYLSWFIDSMIGFLSVFLVCILVVLVCSVVRIDLMFVGFVRQLLVFFFMVCMVVVMFVQLVSMRMCVLGCRLYNGVIRFSFEFLLRCRLMVMNWNLLFVVSWSVVFLLCVCWIV